METAGARWRVLIGSRSFGRAFPEHIEMLRRAGCDVTPNKSGRAYREKELIEALRGMDAIITGTDQLTARVINAAALRTIAKHGVGLDNIDLEAAKARGVIVTYTPGAIEDSVADLAMALMLIVARRIVPAHLKTRKGGWKPLQGFELRGKVLGIIGLGRVGKAVYQRAKGFGMRVVACDPNPDIEFARSHDIPLVTLDDLLEESDIISLHASSPENRRPIIGREELKKTKRTAILVNTARGRLVDEDALAEALAEGRIKGAGLDVFACEPPAGSKLLRLKNVVVTPHMGGQTVEGLRRMGEMTVENCLRALRGEPPLYQVG
ncbi:MAG: phosphoglycerate dehydrogenase [Candidatus Bathyarchaeia archaeon]